MQRHLKENHMANGLSKKTNLQGDIAKKNAPKLGSAPFSKAIGHNVHGSAKHPGATHPTGKGSAGKKFTDGSSAKGWK
jgi:hypothetical protein